MKLIRAIVTAAAGFLATSACLGQWCEPKKVQTLSEPNGNPWDNFGIVAMSGDTAVIGAPGVHNQDGVKSGAAFVYVRQQGKWAFEAELTPSDGQDGGGFGSLVAIDGDTAAIGAPQPFGGNVYIFGRAAGEWTQQAELPSLGLGHSSLDSIAVSGDTAVVGNHGTYLPWEGEADIYQRVGEGWTLQQRLDDDLPWGVTVSAAVSESTIAVGTDGEGVFILVPGQNGWTVEAELRDEGYDTSFGSSLALDGGTLAVGVPRDDAGGVNAGAVYVFEHHEGAWVQAARFNGVAMDQHLGVRVALRGDTVLAGAHRGALLVARSEGLWSQQGWISHNEQSFGRSVAVGDSFALIGEVEATGPGGEHSGLAHAYDLNCGECDADCDRNGVLDLFDFLCFVNQFNAGDPAADCDASGTLDFFDFLCFTDAFNAGC